MSSSPSNPGSDVDDVVVAADTEASTAVPPKVQNRMVLDDDDDGFDAFGFDVLHELVPGPVRTAPVANAGAPLLSSDLYAQHSATIAGPVVEVVHPSQVLLEGVLRAAKHKDALVVVELPRSQHGEDAGRAHQQMAADVEDAIHNTQFERPITLLSSGWRLRELCRAPVEEQMFRVYAAVEAGFTAFRLDVDDDVDAEDDGELDPAAVEEVFDALSSWGVSAELSGDDEVELLALLKQLAHHGRAVAATVGVHVAEVPNVAFSPLPVIDPLRDELTDDTSRLRIDSVLLRSVQRALRDGADGLASRIREHGAAAVLATFAQALDDLDDDVLDRLVAFAYADMCSFLDACGAQGTAGALLDAVVERYEMER